MTGGSIENISVAGRQFSVPADGDSNTSLGGRSNEVESNGDDTARILQTRGPWMISDVDVAVDDANGDLEFLQATSDAGVFVDMTIKYASGETYQGRGIPTGDLQKASANQTVSLVLKGQGKLTKQ